MSKPDVIAFGAALLIHAIAGLAVLVLPARLGKLDQIIEVDLKKKAPPPAKIETPPPPPPKKERPKPVYVPNETPKNPTEPPKEPPKPIFGVSESSTTGGDSSFTVPVGNTTVADPTKTGKPEEVKPLPPAVEPVKAAPPPPPPKPAAILEIKDYPEVEGDSCEIPNRLYPEEAREQGIEGDTQLRVEIDDAGKVRGVKVLVGPGKILDDLAVQWMRGHCKFKPARNTAGQPVAATITYTFHWQLDR